MTKKKFSTKLFAILSALGLSSFVAKATLAAADSDLTTAMASGTSMINDNKGTVLTFIVAVFTAVLVLTLVIVGLSWAIRKIKGSFGGGGKKRP